MTRSPLVSVVTIFLDAERFLQEAIESVVAQTYPHWEILLVDDGSTDASTAIARAYAERCPERVRYLQHEGHSNRGMSASRNLGVRHARGDLIALLDADDVWLPHKLAEQVQLMDAHPPAGMVYGRTKFWRSWNGTATDEANGQRDTLSELGVPPDSLIEPPVMLRYFLKSCPYTCSAMIRKPVFERVGGFEESFRGMYEDQVFFAKVFTHAPVYVSGSCWDRYRQHEDSCCSVAVSRGAFHPSDPSPSGYAFLSWLRTYLNDANVTDERAWRELNDMIGPYERPIRHNFRMGFRKVRRRAVKSIRRLQQAANLPQTRQKSAHG